MCSVLPARAGPPNDRGMTEDPRFADKAVGVWRLQELDV